MQYRSGLGTVVASIAVLVLCKPARAQTPSSAPISVTLDRAPICRTAIFATPPGTSVSASSVAPGTVQLMVTTLADTGVSAIARSVGTALHVILSPHGMRLCDLSLRLTGVARGQHEIVILIDTGRGPPVDVVHTTVAVH